MIYTRCQSCKARIEVGKPCERCRKNYEKIRRKTRPETDRYYLTGEWQTARSKAIAKTFGLDPYSLIVLGIIEHGFTVHHIVPLETDYSLRSEQSNLIYLTEKNHRKIHELYKVNYENTARMLHCVLEKFSEKFSGRG